MTEIDTPDTPEKREWAKRVADKAHRARFSSPPHIPAPPPAEKKRPEFPLHAAQKIMDPGKL